MEQIEIGWIAHEPFLKPLLYVIEKLERQGIRQKIWAFPDYFTESPELFERHVAPGIRALYDARPVIIVWCVHVGNPRIVPFYQNSPAGLNIVIEHDLFSLEPEGCVVTDKPHELLVFTRQHWAYRHDAVAPNRCFTPARWYKLDAPLPDDLKRFMETPEAARWDKWRHAILVESLYYTNAPFPYAGLFDKVFQKPWKETVAREGVVNAPVNLAGPLGIVSAQYLAGFWFSRKSSALVEALFHGCVPVMYPHPEVPSEECGRFFIEEKPHPTIPVLSRVVIDKGNPSNGQIIPTVMVTTSGDFAQKIRVLQADPDLRKQAIREMARQWLFTPDGIQDDWPPPIEAIILDRLRQVKGA
ncbi:MAG TPA: hypothetical protein PK379_13095 [Candidatus Hydrogenedentes bacterium]|nr:hypothetical protein [Candidatus Hydrogenedentota bacterium]HOK90955.1 hypothetical protein [Candidatus Hydrogenedentota bacterium]